MSLKFYSSFILKTIFLLYCFLVSIINCYESNENTWSGKFFPFGPGEKDNNPVVKKIMMGMVDPECDDGKTNLDVDWDGQPFAYTCYEPKFLFTPDLNMNPDLYCHHVPATYSALHICMNNTIEYSGDQIPTFGPHRAIWPRYGEYNYLPPQRWLHNLEHGAIVMLYHPCAFSFEVERLKQLVKSCLHRYIISANMNLPAEKPLALLAWGCRLDMSVVHDSTVKNFIKTYALRGPEHLSRDGVYNLGLIQAASEVDDDNTVLCPEITQQM